MAFTLHTLTHALQFLHFSVSIFAFPFSMLIASAGHTFTHAPQPTQSSVVTDGNVDFLEFLLWSDGLSVLAETPFLTSGILHLGHNNETQGTPRL